MLDSIRDLTEESFPNVSCSPSTSALVPREFPPVDASDHHHIVSSNRKSEVNKASLTPVAEVAERSSDTSRIGFHHDNNEKTDVSIELQAPVHRSFYGRHNDASFTLTKLSENNCAVPAMSTESLLPAAGHSFANESMPPAAVFSFANESMPPAAGLSMADESMPPAAGLSMADESMPPAAGLSMVEESMPPAAGLSMSDEALSPAAGLSMIAKALSPAAGLSMIVKALSPAAKLSMADESMPPQCDSKQSENADVNISALSLQDLDCFGSGVFDLDLTKEHPKEQKEGAEVSLNCPTSVKAPATPQDKSPVKITVEQLFRMLELSPLPLNTTLENYTEENRKGARGEAKLDERFCFESGKIIDRLLRVNASFDEQKQRFNANSSELLQRIFGGNTGDVNEDRLKIGGSGEEKSENKELEDGCLKVKRKEVIDELRKLIENPRQVWKEQLKRVNNGVDKIEKKMKSIWQPKATSSSAALPTVDDVKVAAKLLKKYQEEHRANDHRSLTTCHEKTQNMIKCFNRQQAALKRLAVKCANDWKKPTMKPVKKYSVCCSAKRWQIKYLCNSLVFTAAYSGENNGIVEAYELQSNVNSNNRIAKCDKNLYKLAHTIIKSNVDLLVPTYSLNSTEKLAVVNQIELNVERSLELIRVLTDLSIGDEFDTLDAECTDDKSVDVTIFRGVERLHVQFDFVEKQSKVSGEDIAAKRGYFVPISFNIIKNTSSVSETYISELMTEMQTETNQQTHPYLFYNMIKSLNDKIMLRNK